MPILTCPICRCEVSYTSVGDVPYRPLCSERCKLIDLARWLNEEYRISEELPHPENDQAGRGQGESSAETDD